MDIKIADYIGFCSGVKRAVDMAESRLAGKNELCSIGPIIHNPQVIERLAEKGLKTVHGLNDINSGTFIVRSHGVGPSLAKEAHTKGLEVVDATCPFVAKAQKLVERLSRDEYSILIVGESEHPEIKSLLEYSGGRAEVINSVKEADKCNIKGRRVSVLAQTTQSTRKFLEIVGVLLNKNASELRVFNTICHETTKRQEATRKLAESVEMVIVVGGRNSANTSRLVDICREMKKEVYHIEDESQLKDEWLIKKRSVGVASGASTPDWIIKNVLDKLKKISKEVTVGK